jgi:hypothetical protein
MSHKAPPTIKFQGQLYKQAAAQCRKCGSARVCHVNAKCSDRFYAKSTIDQQEHAGYVPRDMGLGTDGDYVEIDYCLNCGQIQGRFPLKPTKLEQGVKQP